MLAPAELVCELAPRAIWVRSEYAGTSALSAADVAELRRISHDPSALVEKRCHEALDSSPEQRFSSGQPIERRRFCVTASSALLAGILSGLLSRSTLALNSETDDAATADKAPVCDNSCSNAKSANCYDAPGCRDNQCKNTGAVCKDDGCVDVECTNEAVLACSDHQSCLDDLCLNTTNCEDYNPCIDGGVDPCGDIGKCPVLPEPEES